MSELPPIIEELEEVIGLNAALRLVERLGGTELYVPRRLGMHEHELGEIIGHSKMESMVARYGGSKLSIPRCAARLRAERNREICARYASGETARALARQYEMTERWVWYILANTTDAPTALEPTTDDRQGNLF